MASQHLLSKECKVAINHVASSELHVSDVYLSKACYYHEDTGAPLLAAFFQDQAELKRERAKQFVQYLRKREGKICLLVIERPDQESWGSGIHIWSLLWSWRAR